MLKDTKPAMGKVSLCLYASLITHKYQGVSPSNLASQGPEF